MTRNLYSIRDSLVGFSCPTTFVNDDVAVRHFSHVVNYDEQANKNKIYLSLWKVGVYDEESGAVGYELPQLLIQGSDVRTETNVSEVSF